MLKKLFVTLGVIFAVCQAYAQNINEETTEPTEVNSEAVVSSGDDAPQTQDVVSDANPPQTQDVATIVEQLLMKGQADSKVTANNYPIDPTVALPIVGKRSFLRNHYIYQAVEISTLAGKDSDSDTQTENEDSQGKGGGVPSVLSNLNIGMNIGYRIIFVPGRINGDQLEVNRFGFAYSTGLIAAFDRQENYGVTCDFMLKLGFETGNGHALGMGVDGLFGGGKSSGYSYVEGQEDPFYYTDWCMKYGAQVWLKTNLLTTSIRNTDILAFARFIRSVNPYNDEALQKSGIENYWNEESWQFGITLRYRF